MIIDLNKTNAWIDKLGLSELNAEKLMIHWLEIIDIIKSENKDVKIVCNGKEV